MLAGLQSLTPALGNGSNFFPWLGKAESASCTAFTSFSGIASINQTPALKIRISDLVRRGYLQVFTGGPWCSVKPSSGQTFIRCQRNGKSCLIQVGRAVSLTDIPETAVMPWLQHPGALAGQHRWGPYKCVIGRWVYHVQPLLEWSCLLYSKEYYTSYLDHFYCRIHLFPRTFPGSKEKGKELSAWGRILNGFGWILFQIFISPQGEWNRSNFRINFLVLKLSFLPISLTLSPRRVLKPQAGFKEKKLKRSMEFWPLPLPMPSLLSPVLSERRHTGISSEGIVMSSVEHSTKQISIRALELFILVQRLIKSLTTQLAGSDYP